MAPSCPALEEVSLFSASRQAVIGVVSNFSIREYLCASVVNCIDPAKRGFHVAHLSMRAVRFIWVVIGAVLLPGCTLPMMSYRTVDQTTSAFREAVAREKEHLDAEGQSAAKAEAIAVKRVTAQFVAAEKARRSEDVAPLVAAMEAFEHSRGCWAYTVTTTSHVDGKLSQVWVERFDPFLPENQLWTLVSQNGLPPDEATQADYRKKKLRAWTKQQKRSESAIAPSKHVGSLALSADFETSAPTANEYAFIFTRGRVKMPLVGDMSSSRDTYVIERGNGCLLRRESTSAGPDVLLGGSTRIEYFASVTEYLQIDPSLPPFVGHEKTRFRFHFLGRDSGAQEQERVYSGYRRVKCYDDRFQTRVGTPNVLDFVPDSE